MADKLFSLSRISIQFFRSGDKLKLVGHRHQCSKSLGRDSRQTEACRTSSSMLEIVGSRRRFVRPFAARRSLAARPLLAFALDQIRLFLLEHFALLEIFVAIEVDLAFDDRHLRYRVHRKRMLAEDYDVGILAHVDRARPLVDA